MIVTLSRFTYAGNLHVLYRAEEAGDVLPPGLHEHDFEHLCIPLGGEIEAFFDDREPIVARLGDQPFEFPPRRKHGIRAKMAGAVFMNVSRVP